MSEVIILRGVPGSGKSTWVKEYSRAIDEYNAALGPGEATRGVIVVSRDQVRKGLFGSESAHGVDEEKVTTYFNRAFRNGLSMAKYMDVSVIIDNTNCDVRRLDDIVKMTWGFDIPVEIVVIDTPLDEALRRNAARDRVVPEHVIVRMYDQLQVSKDYIL